MKRSTPLRRKSYMTRSTKRIAPVRERFSTSFWRGQCHRVNEIQGYTCAICDQRFTLLDTMHIRGLGRTVYGGRNNHDHELNQLPNLLGGCRRCHEVFDAQPTSTRVIVGAELKKKFEWPDE